MANLGIVLNVDEIEPDTGGGGGVFPKGRYPLQIIESDVKVNSKQTGVLMEYTAEVVSGEYQGRKVYERINVQHQNTTAEQIGQKQLSALARATGVGGNVEDSTVFHFRPFEADLDVDSYKDRNGNDKQKMVVKRYIFEGSDAPPASKPEPTPAAAQPQTAQPQAAKPAAAAAAGKPNLPWSRKAA